MERREQRPSTAGGIGRPVAAIIAATLVVTTCGVSCDQNAQAVFRQTATEPIAEGIKTFLAGDPQAGVGMIVSGAIDGAVASIIEAGDGPTAAQ
ncbi:MAG: hypothetical protein HY718_03935 [Planctomycetes bacterium]|nr:hypothetical protein [Planctomycetota bacterium]